MIGFCVGFTVGAAVGATAILAGLIVYAIYDRTRATDAEVANRVA